MHGNTMNIAFRIWIASLVVTLAIGGLLGLAFGCSGGAKDARIAGDAVQIGRDGCMLLVDLEASDRVTELCSSAGPAFDLAKDALDRRAAGSSARASSRTMSLERPSALMVEQTGSRSRTLSASERAIVLEAFGGEPDGGDEPW